MGTNRFRNRPRHVSESGQVLVFVLLGLGLFLIGATGFAIDLGYLWFSRQAAQTAADAACTAGAMDLLVDATNGTMPPSAGFTPGTGFSCDQSPSAAPCQYATLNGFNSSLTQSQANAGTLGNNVSGSFPSSPPPSSNIKLPPATVISSPLLQVQITDNIPTFFAGILRGLRTQSISAKALCGVVVALSQVPIVVLNPTSAQSLLVQGTPTISIIGGASKSIEVNSNALGNAAGIGGSATVDLCAAGPNYCGGSMGVWGAEPAPGGFVIRCSGNNQCKGTQQTPQWNSPSPPVADPFATTPAPQAPGVTGTFTTPDHRTNGCPDSNGCIEFTPGLYSGGIKVPFHVPVAQCSPGTSCCDPKGTGTHICHTAIFDPGVYWLTGSPSGCGGLSLCEDTGSCFRPSDQTGQGIGGTIFYFADTNSVGVTGTGGDCPGVDKFNISTGALGFGVKCTSTSPPPPPNVPPFLDGSVLLGPCSGAYGDPLGTNDPLGEQRGILFFQNRSVNAGNNPSWSGGGQMLLAGTMYFHQCVTSGNDTGIGCNFGGAFNDKFTMVGNTNTSTYVLGEIIADQLDLHGSSGINMDLNPNSGYWNLKVSLLQ